MVTPRLTLCLVLILALLAPGASASLAQSAATPATASGFPLDVATASRGPDVSAQSFGPASAPHAPGDEYWAAGFHAPGVSDYISALEFGPDGSLYVGGLLRTAGDIAVNHIARWDGATSSWHPLGSGTNERVNALAVDQDGSVYAGGYFSSAGGTAANYVARWDGFQWHSLSSGTNGWVSALTVGPDGSLYAAGQFTTAGGAAVNNIARWDGAQWHPLGSGLTGVSWRGIPALAFGADGALYVGGDFTRAGGISSPYVARWDGSQWHALNVGGPNAMNGPVHALALGSDGSLYAGGAFNTAGGAAANYIARWDGSQWHSLSSGIGGGNPPRVEALAFGPDGSLYVAGDFTTAGGVAANRVARWDGTSWFPVGEGINRPVVGIGLSLAFGPTGALFAGGRFSMAGGIVASNIARWDGTAWYPLIFGNGINGNIVRALARGSDGSLYVGGQFSTAGSVPANHIARWDGTSWQALGSGLGISSNPVVYALTMGPDGSLYVGGSFPTAGGVTVNNVARWDGTTWHPLGSGMNNFVQDLAIGMDGSLYAAGPFTTAGDVSANRIARWDGSTWHPLGDGLGDIGWTLTALSVGSDGSLYVGGGFTTAGGLPANYIARWDGAAWHSVGSGTNGAVEVLAFGPDGSLYAGGRFTTAGGVATSHIARWDGSEWHPLGSGVDGLTLLSLAFAPDGSLYTGGYFGAAGGVTANNSARWDGAQWHPLGSGTSSPVFALAFGADDSLYAGGQFYTAGGKVSLHIARWLGEVRMASVIRLPIVYIHR